MARALRVIGPRTSCAPVRERVVAQLEASLLRFIDNHPRAHRYVLDAGRSYRRVWKVPTTPEPRSRYAFDADDRAARAAAKALLELGRTTNSFLVATSVALICDDLRLAERAIREGIHRCGREGYAASLVLWTALLHQLRDEPERAIDAQLELASSRIGTLRRSGLAAGALLSAGRGDDATAGRLIERMADEDYSHQRTVMERILQLRSHREGAVAARRVADRLTRVAEARANAPTWILEGPYPSSW